MEPDASQPTIAERRGKSWYQTLSFGTKSNGASRRSSIISDPTDSPRKSKEEYLRNKPLPPLPSPQEPYFEYMFADAGDQEQEVHRVNEILLRRRWQCTR